MITTDGAGGRLRWPQGMSRRNARGAEGLVPNMTGLIVLGTTLVLATVVGLVYRSLDGRLRASSPVSERSPVVEHLGAAGLEPGERATLVQFSSAFCAPCRTTRGLLADVAETVPGVRHVEF